MLRRAALVMLVFLACSGHSCAQRQRTIGPYFADFVCLERKLIIELDGGQHTTQAEDDAVRTAFFERLGFTVVRFWNPDVRTSLDAVLEVILGQLQKCSADSAA